MKVLAIMLVCATAVFAKIDYDRLLDLFESELSATTSACSFTKVATREQFSGQERMVAKSGMTLQTCKNNCMAASDCYGIDVNTGGGTGGCWLTTTAVGTVAAPLVKGGSAYDAWMKVCPIRYVGAGLCKGKLRLAEASVVENCLILADKNSNCAKQVAFNASPPSGKGSCYCHYSNTCALITYSLTLTGYKTYERSKITAIVAPVPAPVVSAPVQLSENQYVLGDIGVDSCPTGFDPITSSTECQNAISDQNYVKGISSMWTTHSKSVCYLCGGCGNTVGFSTSHGYKAWWICKKTVAFVAPVPAPVVPAAQLSDLCSGSPPANSKLWDPPIRYVGAGLCKQKLQLAEASDVENCLILADKNSNCAKQVAFNASPPSGKGSCYCHYSDTCALITYSLTLTGYKTYEKSYSLPLAANTEYPFICQTGMYNFALCPEKPGVKQMPTYYKCEEGEWVLSKKENNVGLECAERDFTLKGKTEKLYSCNKQCQCLDDRLCVSLSFLLGVEKEDVTPSTALLAGMCASL